MTTKDWSGPVKQGRFPRWLFATLAAIGLLGASCDTIATDRVLAEVLETKGEVSIESGQGGRNLTRETRLQAGDTVKTGADSAAMISLLPGMVVQLNPGTLVKIDKLRFARSGNATAFSMRLRQARIELLRGSLFVIMPISFAPAHVEIGTPAGPITATETNLLYASQEEGRVRVVAARGGLSFRATAGPTAPNLAAGYYIDIGDEKTGQAVSNPRRIDAEENVAQKSREALEVEHRAIELMARRRNQPPPGTKL
jgi:hypothetical protein